MIEDSFQIGTQSGFNWPPIVQGLCTIIAAAIVTWFGFRNSSKLEEKKIDLQSKLEDKKLNLQTDQKRLFELAGMYAALFVSISKFFENREVICINKNPDAQKTFYEAQENCKRDMQREMHRIRIIDLNMTRAGLVDQLIARLPDSLKPGMSQLDAVVGYQATQDIQKEMIPIEDVIVQSLRLDIGKLSSSEKTVSKENN